MTKRETPLPLVAGFFNQTDTQTTILNRINMNTIEMTEAQQAEIRQMLLQKQTRLEFSVTMLEIRLKQATLKLRDMVRISVIYGRDLDTITENLPGVPEGSNREDLQRNQQKISFRLLTIKYQIDILLVKVLFDLPLALALEKAQLAALRPFLKDNTQKKWNAEAA